MSVDHTEPLTVDITFPSLTFPDRPVMPTKPLIFDDSEFMENPARRHRIMRADGTGYAAFSIGTGYSTDAAITEFMRMDRRVAFGFARRIVNIDGPPSGIKSWTAWALKVAASYLVMWKTIAWRTTLGRGKVEQELRGKWKIQ